MNADLSLVTNGKFPPLNTEINNQIAKPPTTAPKIAEVYNYNISKIKALGISWRSHL